MPQTPKQKQRCPDDNKSASAGLLGFLGSLWDGIGGEGAFESRTGADGTQTDILYGSWQLAAKGLELNGGVARTVSPLGNSGRYVMRFQGPEGGVGIGYRNHGRAVRWGIDAAGSIFKSQFGIKLGGKTLYIGLDVGAGLKLGNKPGLGCIGGVSLE